MRFPQVQFFMIGELHVKVRMALTSRHTLLVYVGSSMIGIEDGMAESSSPSTLFCLYSRYLPLPQSGVSTLSFPSHILRFPTHSPRILHRNGASQLASCPKAYPEGPQYRTPVHVLGGLDCSSPGPKIDNNVNGTLTSCRHPGEAAGRSTTPRTTKLWPR